jgi:hypothetical protein
MTKEHETLRSIITSIVRSLGSTVTHETLADYCSKLGLNVSFEHTAISKAQRMQEIAEKTPDESLNIVGYNLLEQKLGSEKNRFTLEVLLWKPRPEISNRCKREIAQSLEIDDLFRDAGAFISLLSEIFRTYRSSDFSQWMVFSSDESINLDEVERHVIINPGDWSVEYLWRYLDVYDLTSFRFSRFLEGLSHGDVQNSVDRQKNFVGKVNTLLRLEHLELREVGTSGGYPEFKVVPATDRPSGKPKNLIFASSEKPDIRLGNAISNDIEIVSNADKVLVYDRPIDHKGLTWQQLQDWWRDTNRLENDEQSKNELYARLLQSLPKSSPPQERFFVSYFTTFKKQVPMLPALLPEVWLHWDAKTVHERGVNALRRSRMDFLLLLPNDVRVVIEIDGKEHYANGNLACPKKYSEMVNADRLLKLDGYQVFRFGGYELKEEGAFELAKDFWIRLYQKYGVIPKT